MITKYTKEILEPIVKQSGSMHQVLAALGLAISGGNHSYIKKVIQYNDISMEHFKGQGWNKGNRKLNYKRAEEYLVVYDTSKSVETDRIKKVMLRDGIKDRRCEVCGMTEWQGKEIPLHLHHIDGNRWNNLLENLLVMCPNCHAQTENYGIRNANNNPSFIKRVKKKILCMDCGAEIYYKAIRCRTCEAKTRQRTDYNIEEVKKSANKIGIVKTGELYNVSHTTIRRWIDKEVTV